MNLTYLKIVPKWRSSGMKLFDKIRILRKARGLSQEQLGYSLSRVNKDGISRQTVSDWENGKFEPKLENIRDLAEVFNVSFDALLDESVDLEDQAVLKAVLNKRPYDNRSEYEEEEVTPDVPPAFKKNTTSWRTAVLIAVAVYVMMVGLSSVINLITLFVQITPDTTGWQLSASLYSANAVVCLGLGGVAFAFGLIAALKRREAKKVVSVLLIIATAFFIAHNLFSTISSLISTYNYIARYKNEGWRDISDYYQRVLPTLYIILVYDLILNSALLFVVLFANKKLRANDDQVKQVY